MSKRDKADLAGRIAMASAQVLTRAYGLRPIKISTSGFNPSINPSIVKTPSGYLMIARASRLRCYNDVDYVENSAGVGDINYLYTLDSDFRVLTSAPLDELLLREKGFCIGHCLSDARLFYWGHGLWGIGAAAQQFEKRKIVKQVLFRIEGNRVSDVIPLDSPAGFALEKNWTPVLEGGLLRLIYSFSPLNILRIEGRRAVLENDFQRITHHDARGGTQLIEYQGGYLGLVHQAPNMWNGKRSYTHSFVWFTKELKLLEISEPFYIQRKGLEFAAGICAAEGGVIVSYGAADRECMILKIPNHVIETYLTI